jgi:hypothetical protein
VIGLLLSVLLLVETIITYVYVEGDLVREEAQRVSDRHVGSLLRAARLMKVGQSSDLGPVLDEMVHEDPNQIAWIRIMPSPRGTSQLEFVEVAMYLKGISVSFGPLRQDLVVGLSAAIALLGTVVLVGTRFAAYVHAKRIEKELAVARQVQTDFFPIGNSK